MYQLPFLPQSLIVRNQVSWPDLQGTMNPGRRERKLWGRAGGSNSPQAPAKSSCQDAGGAVTTEVGRVCLKCQGPQRHD